MNKINSSLVIKALIFSIFLFAYTTKTNGQKTMDINQTLSDGAQRNTIAFDGLAFLTGNFCACTFIPPGKVADYFGFQFLRDNDITHMGHTTDFNTVIANNLMYVLDSAQKAKLVELAKAQVPLINQYAYDRLPLIKAFVRLRDKDIPSGSTGLDKDTVKAYSAKLYRLDGLISIQRAKLYAGIIKALNAKQKHYLDSVSLLGMKNMPVLPDQIDKRPLNNNEFVAVMSFAGDIYSWYVGNVDSDVYFCPERQGNYFGGFYIKDAPAMGHHGYQIDTNLTQNGGSDFINALTPQQASLITDLVGIQKTDLYALVDRRTDISNLLRSSLTGNNIDTAYVLSLSEIYGQLDGEISYFMATNFSRVGWSLTSAERDTLNKIRNLDKYPCVGAYLYSDSIGEPNIINTDFFFNLNTSLNELRIRNYELGIKIYPNPAKDQLNIVLPNDFNNFRITLFNTFGQVILQTGSKVIDISSVSNGVYYLNIKTSKGEVNKKLIINN